VRFPGSQDFANARVRRLVRSAEGRVG
jgi:hypothetical protein